MEDDEGRKAAQAEGKRPCEEENQSSSASAAAASVDQVKGKRPYEDLVENPKVMEEEEEEDREGIDYGEDWMEDGGYYIRYEGNQVIIVGERPKPVWRSLGRAPPHALTFKRIARRLRETGLGSIPFDDPIGKSSWNPFPFPVAVSPSQKIPTAPASSTASATDTEA